MKKEEGKRETEGPEENNMGSRRMHILCLAKVEDIILPNAQFLHKNIKSCLAQHPSPEQQVLLCRLRLYCSILHYRENSLNGITISVRFFFRYKFLLQAISMSSAL